MNISRLQSTYAFLRDQIPESRFNLDKWVYKAKCGTIACAAGWMSYSPEAQAAGFHLKERNKGMFIPMFHGAHSYGAIAEYFDICILDAEALFGMYPGMSKYNPMVMMLDSSGGYLHLTDKARWLRRMEIYAAFNKFDLPPKLENVEPAQAVVAALAMVL